MKTVNIKGTDYVQVNERVKFFREHYPDYRLVTKLESLENGVCVFRAMVTDQDGNLLSTGHAYEKENSTFINKTSYIENCETSAIGRALGFFGIGIDASIAAAEEVMNAVMNQDTKPKTSNVSVKKKSERKDGITKEQKDIVSKALEDGKITMDEIKDFASHFNSKNLATLSQAQVQSFIDVHIG